MFYTFPALSLIMATKVNRVHAKDLEMGAKAEQQEHAWASPRTARKIARDHLQKDPDAYSDGGGKVVVILNQNVKAIPPHKRKKSAPAQQQAVDDKPPWIPNTLRRPF